MALNVQKRIAKLRGNQIKSSDSPDNPHLVKQKKFLKDFDEIVTWISSAIIRLLSESLDDLNTAEAEFRSGIQRCVRRLLKATISKEERVIFFHEVIPGFTVIAVKKEGWDDALNTNNTKSKKNSKDKSKPLEKSINLEKELFATVEAIMNQYVSRTGNRAISIEGEDLILILFPVSDLKKNLQEMGFWPEY